MGDEKTTMSAKITQISSTEGKAKLQTSLGELSPPVTTTLGTIAQPTPVSKDAVVLGNIAQPIATEKKSGLGEMMEKVNTDMKEEAAVPKEAFVEVTTSAITTDEKNKPVVEKGPF